MIIDVYMIDVYDYWRVQSDIYDWRHMRRKNAIEISSIFWHVKLQSNFIEITLSRKFAAHFQKPFPKNTSGGLLLSKKNVQNKG